MTVHVAEGAIALKPSASIAAKRTVTELQATGHHVINFTINEPNIAAPPHIVDAARAGERHYTTSAKTPPLHNSIAEMLFRDKSIPCKPENVAVGCGAKQLIFEAFASTLNDGDEVIVPAPYWVSYPDLASLHGGRAVIVTCVADVDFKLTPAALEAVISSKCEAPRCSGTMPTRGPNGVCRPLSPLHQTRQRKKGMPINWKLSLSPVGYLLAAGVGAAYADRLADVKARGKLVCESMGTFEPFSFPDPEMVGEVLTVMKELAHSGITMMCDTHEMGFAREVADRVWFMDKGEILEDATPDAFLSNPQHKRAKRILADLRH